MLKMVDGTGIIGVDMICPLGISTPQPPNYDRVEMEGAGMLVLPNSLDAPLERLELGGKTEQAQTSGAQLLNKDNFFVNPPTTFDKLKYYPLNIGDKECTLSTTCPASGNTSNLFLLAGNIDKGASSSVNGVSFGISRTVKSQDGYVTIALRTIGDNPNNPLDYDIMLNYGSEAKPYEPYTGGKPSPSPEYPQEIKNSGKWNEETQKYEVDVKVTGKNLLNLQKASEKVNWTQHSNFPGYYNFPVFVGRGNTVTISIPQKIPTGQGLFLSVCLTESGVREGWIAHSSNDSLNNTKLTYKATNDYIYLNAHSDTIAGMKKYFGNLQVEYGNVATPYQPYKEQTLTLTSDRPITKWDKLVEQGGQYGWLYKHKIIEDFSALVKDTEPIYGNDGGKYFSVSLQNASLNYDRSKIYSEAGVYGKDNKIHYIPQPMTTNAIINVSDTDTIMTAKEHMHYKVIYETTESQFTHLPQSEQNAIRALKTYYPTTVITVDGGELDPDIKVTYRKEI